jgi:hypothetical protein
MREARPPRSWVRAVVIAAVLSMAAVFGGALSSCAGIWYRAASAGGLPITEPFPVFPSARFAVLSDPHLYDVDLGSEGSAFQRDMENDRKMLPESREILAAALQQVRDLAPDFLLVPGDLTKDGELQDHRLMAEMLSPLARQGVHVYVVPGNHDILDPWAVRYEGAARRRVPNVTPAEFREIYRDAGYGEALFCDPGSLSYVAEPVPGLWLVAVDSADYDGNLARGAPQSASGFTPARAAWIETMLDRALQQKKAVIVMMHHGVVEHFAGQAKYFPRSLAKDWQHLGDMLAVHGVPVVFTGHFHAQDIAMRRTSNGRALYDVETGSLVTFPDPMRLVTIDSGTQRMEIGSVFITDLSSFAQRGASFRDYARDFVLAGTQKIAMRRMASYRIAQEEASTLAAQVTAAFAAHFQGDERFPGGEMIRTRGLSPLAAVAVGMRKDLITSLWSDPEPPDNDLVVDLAAGTWEKRN